MDQRRCRFCQGHFDPSRFHPEQTVCSAKVCQQRRRAESRQHKLATDPEYRQVCRDSARKWRAGHPGYGKKHRADKPEGAERNRMQQHRDQHQRLLDLANNNVASAQVFIVPSLRRKPPASAPSCKQHPSGLSAAGA